MKVQIKKLSQDSYDHNYRINDVEKRILEELGSNEINDEKKEIKEKKKNKEITFEEEEIYDNKSNRINLKNFNKKKEYDVGILKIKDEEGEEKIWIEKLKDIEELGIGENELNFGKRNRAKILRKELEKTNICTLCGSKKHNELNHHGEKICEECGFIQENEICLLDRNNGDILFRNKYNKRIDRIIGIDTMNEIFCIEMNNREKNFRKFKKFKGRNNNYLIKKRIKIKLKANIVSDSDHDIVIIDINERIKLEKVKIIDKA